MSSEKSPEVAEETNELPPLPDVETASLAELAMIVRRQHLIVVAIAQSKPKFVEELAVTSDKLRNMATMFQVIFPKNPSSIDERRQYVSPTLEQSMRQAVKAVTARVDILKGPTIALTAGLRKAQVQPLEQAVIALEADFILFKEVHQSMRLVRLERKVNEMMDMLSVIAGKAKESDEKGTLPEYSESSSGAKNTESEAPEAS